MTSFNTSSSSSSSGDKLIVDFPDRDVQARASAATSTNKAPASAPKRSVRFSQMSSLAFIEKPSKDIIDVKWYSKADRAHFKQTLKLDVMRMQRILATVPKEFITEDVLITCVGMEHLMSQELTFRTLQRRSEHRGAVMGEQDRQEFLYLQDDEAIRESSEKFTQWSRERAHRLAVGYSSMHAE